jgi:hypothetical protein
MRKLWIAVLALVTLVPLVANAQSFNKKNLAISAGLGASIPARYDEFRESGSTGVYRYLNGEYLLTETGHIWLTGQYDYTNYNLDDGTDLSNVGLGMGVLIDFDLIPKWQNTTGFIEISAMHNNLDEGESQWHGLGGAGINFDFKGNARGRVGVKFRDLSNEAQVTGDGLSPVGAWFAYAGVTVRPWE